MSAAIHVLDTDKLSWETGQGWLLLHRRGIVLLSVSRLPNFSVIVNIVIVAATFFQLFLHTIFECLVWFLFRWTGHMNITEI